MKIFVFQNQEAKKNTFIDVQKKFEHNFLKSKQQSQGIVVLCRPKISMRNFLIPKKWTMVYSFKIESICDSVRYFRIIMFTDRISYLIPCQLV